MIKAVFFDMDGVLIDAREWHFEALNRALDKFGMAIDRDTHLAAYDGLPTRKKLVMLSKSRGLPQGLHEFLNALKQRYTLEIAHALCKPTFAHQRALSKLKADGYKIAVCSNSVRDTVHLMMKLSTLDGYLDLMLSNEDVTRPKPDPDMYETAMRSLGCAPHECLIVEDNDHGVEAARAAGGAVLIVGSPAEVTYEAIANRIATIQAGAPAA